MSEDFMGELVAAIAVDMFVCQRKFNMRSSTEMVLGDFGHDLPPGWWNLEPEVILPGVKDLVRKAIKGG